MNGDWHLQVTRKSYGRYKCHLLEWPFPRQAGEVEVNKLSFEFFMEIGKLSVPPGAEVPAGHIDIVHLRRQRQFTKSTTSKA